MLADNIPRITQLRENSKTHPALETTWVRFKSGRGIQVKQNMALNAALGTTALSYLSTCSCSREFLLSGRERLGPHEPIWGKADTKREACEFVRKQEWKWVYSLEAEETCKRVQLGLEPDPLKATLSWFQPQSAACVELSCRIRLLEEHPLGLVQFRKDQNNQLQLNTRPSAVPKFPVLLQYLYTWKTVACMLGDLHGFQIYILNGTSQNKPPSPFLHVLQINLTLDMCHYSKTKLNSIIYYMEAVSRWIAPHDRWSQPRVNVDF